VDKVAGKVTEFLVMPGSTSVSASPRPAAIASDDILTIASPAPGPSHVSGPHAQLPIPVRGTEDYRKIGEGIWSYAWDVAVLGHPPATPFDVHEAGLAIDPPIHRSQHQVGQSPTLLLCLQQCCCTQPAAEAPCARC